MWRAFRVISKSSINTGVSDRCYATKFNINVNCNNFRPSGEWVGKDTSGPKSGEEISFSIFFYFSLDAKQKTVVFFMFKTSRGQRVIDLFQIVKILDKMRN